jgi:hypothetical protein
VNRKQRREQERLHRKREQSAARAGVPIMATSGHIITDGGTLESFAGARELPPKAAGRHRWVATAMYSLTEESVAAADDPDTMKYLDHENLTDVLIGCWDCEQALGQIQAGSHCPGDPP